MPIARTCAGWFVVAGLFVAALASPSASAQALGENPDARILKNPIAASAASIATGQASYRKNCRFCHGEGAKGDGKQAPKDSHPADLTDGKWDRGDSDGEIFAVIQNGTGPKFEMKGFKSRLTVEETWHLVNYLRSLGPQGTP